MRRVIYNVNLFLSMLGVGLVTSIHCVFMCGGLVLTYAVKGTEEGPLYRRLLPHLAYQGAKILSYATVALVLGGIVALLGRAFDITPFRNWLMVAAGVYMVLLGIGMTGRVKALRNLTPKPPQFLIRALSKNRKQAVADANAGTTSLATPLTFGLLTGLMPCAPLIAAQAAAISAGSPALGALAMVGFGLGTAPLMLAFGFVSSLLSKQFQSKLQIVAAVAVMVFGLVILNRGLMVVGSPVTFDTVRNSVLGGPQVASDTTQFRTGADGVVEIPLTIENVRFSPQNVSLPADKPVRLIVDRKEANACSAQLAIPQLGVLANLKDNAVTVVDVPGSQGGLVHAHVRHGHDGRRHHRRRRSGQSGGRRRSPGPADHAARPRRRRLRGVPVHQEGQGRGAGSAAGDRAHAFRIGRRSCAGSSVRRRPRASAALPPSCWVSSRRNWSSACP